MAGIHNALIGTAVNFGPPAYVFAQTISTNTTNYNLKSAAIAAGWNQTDVLQATVTINSGVYVYSTSTGAYAFSTGTTFPAGSTLALVNNGTILGMGGGGGIGAGSYNPAYGAISTAGAVGGPAILAQNAISITNNGVISGGGGGGGGGGFYVV
jgi:hypothetical protein